MKTPAQYVPMFKPEKSLTKAVRDAINAHKAKALSRAVAAARKVA